MHVGGACTGRVRMRTARALAARAHVHAVGARTARRERRDGGRACTLLAHALCATSTRALQAHA
eukprot:4349233-Pleurochrysis_carterae.AAC.1